MALPLSDPFRKKYDDVGGVDWPAISAAAVTPDDGVDLDVTPLGLYIGVAGDVAVDMANSGSSILFKAVRAGILAIRPRRVRATGTTATKIVAIGSGHLEVDVNALMLTNWGGSWSPTQQAMAPALVSCSPTTANLDRTASPVPGAAKTIIGTQAALGLYDNAPPTVAGQFPYQLATEAVANGYDLLSMVRISDGGTSQARMRTYAQAALGTQQETFLLDMTKPAVPLWWANLFHQHFPWVDGWHCDYWTKMDWIFSDAPALNPLYSGVADSVNFWNAYMDGLSAAMAELRRLRTLAGKPTLIIGQQWHNNRPQDCFQLDGRYIEDYPWRWGAPNPWVAYHQTRLTEFAGYARYAGHGPPQHVFELRYPSGPPNNFSQSQRNEFLAFCASTGSLASWGRDATAGVGWPGLP